MTLEELRFGNELYEEIQKLENFIIAQSKLYHMVFQGFGPNTSYAPSQDLEDKIMRVLQNELRELYQEFEQLGRRNKANDSSN